MFRFSHFYTFTEFMLSYPSTTSNAQYKYDFIVISGSIKHINLGLKYDTANFWLIMNHSKCNSEIGEKYVTTYFVYNVQ
jgi:hypothetical protein